MKRKVLTALLLLAVMLAVCGFAQAAETPIKCSIEVSPSNLTQAQTIDVTISISNTSTEEVPVILKAPDAQNIADFGTNGEATLAAGDTKTWKGTWDVTEQQLQNGEIYYYLYYFVKDETGEQVQRGMNIIQKINFEGTLADITVTRSVSPTTAREGQTVTILYDITNSGNVDLNKVSVKENSSVSKKTGSIEKLEPGKRAQIKFEVKMAKKDLTSGATISYTPEGESKAQSTKVDDLKITYGEPKMTATLSTSAKGVVQGGTFVLTLQLENESTTVEYTDLRVNDPLLGELFSNQTLGPKNSATGKLTLTKELTLAETTTYQFTITAIDNATNEVSLTSDSITVTAVDPTKVVHLTLTASSDRVEIFERPGIVRFTIEVANDSDVDATDVRLLHGATELTTISSLKAGESRTIHRDASVSQEGKYQFSASLKDALDDTKEFYSNEMQIIYTQPTPAPATEIPSYMQTAEPTFQPATYPSIADPNIGGSFKSIWNIGMYIAIAAGVLLAGCLVLLAIAAKKRADRKRASDAAYDHLERAARRDYIAPAQEEGTTAKVLGKENEKDGFATPEAGLDPDGEELPHVKYARNAVERQRQEEADAISDTEPYTYADDEYDDYADGASEEEYMPEETAQDDRASYARPAASSEDTEQDDYTQQDPYAEQDEYVDDAYEDEERIEPEQLEQPERNPYARPVDDESDTGRRRRTRTERHISENE